jgi:hypothetical protein
MQTDLASNWPWIRRYFNKSLMSTRFHIFSTTGADGQPHMAPYGSLVLNDDCNGYYSDVFPNRMSRNLAQDNRICIMAVHFGMWYWLKGLFLGRFDHWPGLRLYGTVEKSRKASPDELESFQMRVKRFKRFKGYDLLWKDIRTVRDIRFTHFDPVYLGSMTRHMEARLSAAP